MGKRRGTISTWERDIEVQLTNIIFSFTISADEAKVDQYSDTIRKISRRLHLIRVFLLTLSVILLMLSIRVAEELKFPFLSFLLLIAAMYLLFGMIGLTFIRPLGAVPISHQIFIHSHPKTFVSLVIITKYLPRGQSLFTIPLDTIKSVSLARRSLIIWPKRLELEALEIVLSGDREKIIARLGGLCREDEIRTAATELWRRILEIREKEKFAAPGDKL